jgi:hypothetical protein
MGKWTRVVYRSNQRLTPNLAGRHSYLPREPARGNQGSACQIPAEERYQGCVLCDPELFIGSGVFRHDNIAVDPNQPRPQFFIGVFYFYDAPTPSSVFDDFLAIPALAGELSTTSFADFVNRVQNPFLGHRLGGHSTK